jgi:tetratricopeptide (TPR) repeat protein
VARDEELGREVALKEIRHPRALDPGARSQFVREAQVTGRLEHPGIILVYGLGRGADGRPFYAMRLILGPTLRDACDRFHADKRLRDDPTSRSLELRKLLRHFLDVCNAIGYAHGQGVLHLDLKPDNVMLGRYGETQVVDWGLTRRPTAAEVDGAGLPTGPPREGDAELAPGVRGTLGFMSPEQATGDPDAIGRSSDVFGLGATLYYFLTGRAPYEREGPGPGGSDVALLRCVREGKFPPPRAVVPSVPPALNAICLKAMRPNPGDRYASPGALAADVERWLADEPVSAYPDPWRTRAARWVRRNKPTAAASVILLAVAVVSLALSTFLIAREADRARTAEQASAREAGRARTAERQTQALLAASYAAAARLASQRGAWKDALANFDKALDAGHPDPLGIRLGKVRAWVALDQMRDAFYELEGLAGRNDLGPYEGQVLLWKADLGHARGLDATAKKELLQRALAVGLDGADRAYAEGLLARTSAEAIGQFRRALRLDPFHNRATNQLAWLLSVLGRRQEARDELVKAELIFPDDPSPRVIHALLLAADGDSKGAEGQLDRTRDHVGPVVFGGWQSAVRFIARYHDLDALLLDQAEADSDSELLRFLLRVWAESGLGRPDLPVVIDPDRMTAVDYPPFLTDVFRRLIPSPKVLPAIAMARLGVAGPWHRELRHELDELDEAIEVLPVGELVLFRSILLLAEGQDEAAEGAALQAAEMPSLLKVRRMALFVTLLAEQRLLGRPVAPPDLRDRVRRNIRALAATGYADPKRSAFLVALAVLVGEVDLARSVLDDWERRSPRDPDAWAHRAAVERHGRSYGRAIPVAQEALRVKPGHPLAVAALDASLKLLREEGRALAPASVDPLPPRAVDFFNLARAHALCASRPANETRSPTPTELAGRESQADQAMAALRRAVDTGWRDATRLAQEHDLDPLRSRDDFAELFLSVLDVNFPADPFGIPK